MKWTRASERLPEVWGKAYFCKDGDRNRVYSEADIKNVASFNDKLYWLDESDESPESSVWPGEEEINEFDSWLFNNGFSNAMRRIMIATLKEWYPQWLQSRTV